MLFLLRIALTAGLVWSIHAAGKAAGHEVPADDVTHAAYVGLVVAMAILTAIVWAPFVGEKVSVPITNGFVDGTFIENKRVLLRLVRWLESRGHRRATLFFCFLEGINHPSLPMAFVIGLRNAKPGSWLEKVFAREVFRFDNGQHCLIAYDALKRHGVDPGCHPRPEINLLIRGRERKPVETSAPIAIPHAPEPPHPKRNPRIRIFARTGEEQAETNP